MRAKNYSIVLVCLENDREIPVHSEPHDICFYPIEGSGTFTTGNEKVDLARGEMVFSSAGMPGRIKSKDRMVAPGMQEPN